MTLYMVIAECPHCNDKAHFIEETDQPVDLMHDIGVKAMYCPTCGINVDQLDGEWIIIEETRVERVNPVEEPNT